MKRFLFLISGFALLVGCEDVIEVDVPNDEPRLSIDGLIRLNTNLLNTEIRIVATETSSFFEEIGSANLDRIELTNSLTNQNINLTENPLGSGIYIAEWSVDQLMQGELVLSIDYNGSQYEAKTTFVPTVPFDNLIQGDGTLFSGDETEILVSYTDEPNREDFYLFDFDFEEYLVSEDTFYLGQAFEFSYFYEDGLEPGQELNISILGVDEIFYNYMNQLIVQSGGDQGPFQTPAATVKGNIVNLTDSDNFALGFFAVCQTFNGSIIIE
ncbi:DUF4249 family protein [Maribacter sp. HTCC2170]|uniref:DUF4249 family protein n=1 Tax=Maribacter sp. (strain HTCC2170 / KCCM 42371) TaxID=313603 RepID=UPI00006B4858|nr:DUF4249 family protein [Maribacter sp. HTCC2170]EAR01558.1 hypothetical protein FB2170_13558 [Maribacter sp. HTCC2170]